MDPLIPTPTQAPLSAEVPPGKNGVTEGDETIPDSLLAEREQRLLAETLYASWAGPGEGRTFLALANVGYFPVPRNPALVPDFFLCLDATAPENLQAKQGQSYYQWHTGRPPDVVIEIVSDKRGGEADVKMRTYARHGVIFYVIHDPWNILKGGVLRTFGLHHGRFEPLETAWFPEVGLGLTLWEGAYEDSRAIWLRWCDKDGRLLPTGKERADEQQRRAEEAIRKQQRLEAQLRALGIEPEV